MHILNHTTKEHLLLRWGMRKLNNELLSSSFPILARPDLSGCSDAVASRLRGPGSTVTVKDVTADIVTLNLKD
jgi:hypothetical protein